MPDPDILIRGADGKDGVKGDDAPNASEPLNPNGKDGVYDKDKTPECVSADNGKDGLNASENGGPGEDGFPGQSAFEFILQCGSLELETPLVIASAGGKGGNAGPGGQGGDGSNGGNAGQQAKKCTSLPLMRGGVGGNGSNGGDAGVAAEGGNGGAIAVFYRDSNLDLPVEASSVGAAGGTGAKGGGEGSGGKGGLNGSDPDKTRTHAADGTGGRPGKGSKGGKGGHGGPIEIRKEE